MHLRCIVARAQCLRLVELMRPLDGIEIEIDAKARALRHSQHAIADQKRIERETLPILPDPVRVNGRDGAGRGGRYMRNHRQGNVEVVVRVRAPSEPIVAAHLRDAYRSLHGPEVRIGQWYVDGMQTVCWEDIRNYHWEFYREMLDTRNDVVSHAVIKNPWFCPVAFQVENRRWELDRWYRVTFLQENNRLRGAIDDVTVFDVSDSGLTNNGPVMRRGRVALRVMMRSDMTFRNLEISNRPNYV